MGVNSSSLNPTTPTIQKKDFTYKINDKVSYIKDGKTFTGMVSGVKCIIYVDEKGSQYGNLCDLTKSSINMIDNNRSTHEVFIDDPSLQIVHIQMSETKKYTTNSKVSFLYDGNIVTGTIRKTSTSVDLGKDYIDNGNSNLEVVLEYKGENDRKIIVIPFSQPELKLVVPVSGKQKYTLEDDNKYRIKYMKYKTKYLLQK